jgi:phage/plasmid-like protein (TIGR03299 family)
MPELLSSDGILMAANITRGHPWHELGQILSVNTSLTEALEITGSNDTVIPSTLYTRNDDGTYEELDSWQAVKSDKYGTLGVHGPGFNIKQRREILEMAYDFTGLDYDGSHVEVVGNSPNFRKFFAYVRVPDLVIDPNGIADTIERGLFVATSFDGTLPNFIGYSSIRVACFNAVQMAMKGASQIIKAKHTRNADDRMETAAIAHQYVGAVEKATIANAEKMLSVDGDKALDTILDHFYPVEDEKLSDIAKTRRLRERGDIRLMYQGSGNTNIDLVGRNGWAAYNAFTEYVDHASGIKLGKQAEKAGQQRANRALFPGRFVDMKIKASGLVLEMAA